MRKTILILAILLVFVYGIFGIPNGISPSAWKTALTDRIHLGLDLKGGIHPRDVEENGSFSRIRAQNMEGVPLKASSGEHFHDLKGSPAG